MSSKVGTKRKRKGQGKRIFGKKKIPKVTQQTKLEMEIELKKTLTEKNESILKKKEELTEKRIELIKEIRNLETESDELTSRIKMLGPCEFRYNQNYNATAPYEHLHRLMRDRREIVTKVTFPISSKKSYTETIKFDPAVTVQKAIQEAENFLSIELTEGWYNKISNDLWGAKLPWETAQIKYRCYGDLLTDSIQLDDVEIDDTGEMTLVTS